MNHLVPAVQAAYTAFYNDPKALACFERVRDTKDETREMIVVAAQLLLDGKLPAAVADVHGEIIRDELKPYHYASDFLNRISRKTDHEAGHAPTALWLAVIDQLFSDVLVPSLDKNKPLWRRQAMNWFESTPNPNRVEVCNAAGLTEEYVLRKYREYLADPSKYLHRNETDK